MAAKLRRGLNTFINKPLIKIFARNQNPTEDLGNMNRTEVVCDFRVLRATSWICNQKNFFSVAIFSFLHRAAIFGGATQKIQTQNTEKLNYRLTQRNVLK